LSRPAQLVVLCTLVLTVAACGGGGGGDGGGDEGVSGSLSVMGVWSGPEQESFEAVLDGFMEAYPNVDVTYTSAGDQLPTQLSTAVAGGNPPDVAALPQPGLMNDLVDKGALTEIEYAREDVQDNLGDSAVALGSVDDVLYGFLFKAANKSTVWYNVAAFDEAGVEAPTTWDEFTENADTLKASGIPAYSIGGADGWTLTDLFENIYLRQAGEDNYDKLATHAIPWTDETVITALQTMADIFKDTSNIAGNPQQIDFTTSVSNVFSDSPKAAQVIEGDFVPGVVQTDLQPVEGYNVFAFPAIDDSPAMVVGGGDTIVSFNDDEATQALVTYLTTPEAAEIWAERGGFASLNKGVDASVYPDEISQETAGAIGEAEVFRFDLSDLQPSAFGGTVGQGLFKEFQDLLANPDDVQGVAEAMEKSAQEAYG
jgi:alpha-glucoside transport system substrate-binding protein